MLVEMLGAPEKARLSDALAVRPSLDVRLASTPVAAVSGRESPRPHWQS